MHGRRHGKSLKLNSNCSNDKKRLRIEAAQKRIMGKKNGDIKKFMATQFKNKEIGVKHEIYT